MAIDGMNFIHRARAGFVKGESSVIFNFFRNLRALVERFNPTRIYFVLDGSPVIRRELFPEYKTNRKIDPQDHDAINARDDFFRQKDVIVDLLTRAFPVSVMHHPEAEADDVIHNLIDRSTRAVDWIVVSNDSDFTQLLDTFENVQVYNPMKKEYVERVDYDYVTWKSLCGDGSDNIPGIPGVGAKTAEKLARDLEKMREFLSDEEKGQRWLENYKLIKFIDFTDLELSRVTSSNPKNDWTIVKKAFEDLNFNSLLKEKTWNKFVDTFDYLWGENIEPIEAPYV